MTKFISLIYLLLSISTIKITKFKLDKMPIFVYYLSMIFYKIIFTMGDLKKHYILGR